jgi:hypothetical protein
MLQSGVEVRKKSRRVITRAYSLLEVKAVDAERG